MTEVIQPVAEAPPEPAEPQEQRVTPLELLLDLVFVLAITQVTGYVSHDPTWTRFVEGLAILALVWWVWSSYAWLGNAAATDEGLARVVLMAAAAGMLVASIAVPHAFGDDALLFGIAILVVRVLHLAAYTLLARSRGDKELTRGGVRPGADDPPGHAADRRGRARRTAPPGPSAGARRCSPTTAVSRCGAPAAGASSRATSPSATG